MTEEELERAQVEAVFRVEGNLSDSPLTWFDELGEEHVLKYWYDGAPEYCRKELVGEHGDELVTVIDDFLFGPLPSSFTDEHEDQWKLVASFSSSGETECPWGKVEDLPPVLVGDGRCALCEAEPGEHGHVYLGDEWHEAVYRRYAKTRDDEE